MRTVAVVLLLASWAAFSADEDFNGRWNITVSGERRSRVWWLEVTGAGAGNLKGRFVGAPGGDMNDIPEISIRDGELRFVFERRYGQSRQQPEAPMRKGIYTARAKGGKLHGRFEVEGQPDSALSWTGVRAPVIRDRDDGTWRESKPIELFNGKDLSGWRPMVAGQPLGWGVKEGYLTNHAGANNLVSERKFWNFKLHAEYRLGAKSNSGIGLRGRYEVQILEDRGRTPDIHSNAALYSRIAPSVNASKPPGEWQTLEVTLIGRQVTVVLNGVKVIDKGEVEGLTAMASDSNEGEPGPLTIQGDHGPVEFRKLVVTPMVK